MQWKDEALDSDQELRLTFLMASDFVCPERKRPKNMLITPIRTWLFRVRSLNARGMGRSRLKEMSKWKEKF